MMSVFCENALVKRAELWDVVGTDRWQINNTLDDQYEPRPACLVVQEALEYVGAKLPYCVFQSNCEHFATELRYGKAQSRQVRCRITSLLYVYPSIHPSIHPVSQDQSIAFHSVTSSFPFPL